MKIIICLVCGFIYLWNNQVLLNTVWLRYWVVIWNSCKTFKKNEFPDFVVTKNILRITLQMSCFMIDRLIKNILFLSLLCWFRSLIFFELSIWLPAFWGTFCPGTLCPVTLCSGTLWSGTLCPMLPKLGTFCPGTLCPGTFWPDT